MRRSRLKILPTRCLSFLGFILVMLVCPTIAEINVGIGQVYEPGHSDSELQHPAANFLRTGFEVCQIKDGPRREDIPRELPPDGHIASLEEGVRFTRKSEPQTRRETMSRRGERIQHCHDSRRTEDLEMRRNKIQFNFRLANREEVWRRNSRSTTMSRVDRRSSVQLPQRTVEDEKEARQRVNSERRNDMTRSQSRINPVLQGERLNNEEMSYRRKDERRILRRNTANEFSRNVDTRRTSSKTRSESSERISSVRDVSKNSNINERRDDIFRQSTTGRENTVPRLTRRTSSFTKNQERISSEAMREPENERSLTEQVRRLKSRGMSLDESRRIDPQRQQRGSVRRDLTRLTARITRTSGLDPTDRRMTLNTGRQGRTREAREAMERDHRVTRMARSLERRSMVDTGRQEKVSDETSGSPRRDRSSERGNVARHSIRLARSINSIPSEFRSMSENERRQNVRETTMRSGRQNNDRRLERDSEKRESTRQSLRRFRSLDSISVERRSMMDDKSQYRAPGQISNAITQTDSRRRERESDRRDTAIPSVRMVRSVRLSDSPITSTVDAGQRRRSLDVSLSSRRHSKESERKDAARLAVRTSRSVETESEERRSSFLDSERQQRILGASLNSIRRTDNRRNQRESESRTQRIVRTESVLTPSYSERQRRTRDTTSQIRRQERESERKDIAVNKSFRMIRSTESLERRLISDKERRNQENRDANYNPIRQAKDRRSQLRESERGSIERRSVMNSETQERSRDVTSMSQRQQRESQRRDPARHSIRMAKPLESILTERRLTENSDRRQRSRDAHENVQRREIRKPDHRSARMVGSTESLPLERRSYADIEHRENSRETILNPIRHTDHRRQIRNSERRYLTNQVVRNFRSLESISNRRGSEENFDRQERFQDITSNNRRQRRELSNGDSERSSIRIARSLESLTTERRSNFVSARQQENVDAIMARRLVRRSVEVLERKERLPYLTSRSRKQEGESERRHSIPVSARMVRSIASNGIERRSISESARERRTQDISTNSRRQEMGLERREPELRSVRRVMPTVVNPSQRSVDIERQEMVRTMNLNSQRRRVESERRDLAHRVVRQTRSLPSISSERILPSAIESRRVTRELALTSGQTNNEKYQTQSDKGDLTRRVNRITRSVESVNDRRSEAVSERHRWTRDASQNSRKQEIQTERENLARYSRTSEQRNDRRREIAHRRSLQRDINTDSFISKSFPTRRSDDSLTTRQVKSRKSSPYINYLDVSSRGRRVKESRISPIASDSEEYNDRLVFSRTWRKNSLLETSVPSKEARNINRRANLKTCPNLQLLNVRQDRMDARSRNGRVSSVDNNFRTVEVGLKIQNYSPTRRINHNIPSRISMKMKRTIEGKEGSFGTILSETRNRDVKAPSMESFYLSEIQLTPDTHNNAKNVMVMSSDHLLGNARRSAIRNTHFVRDTASRSANLQKRIYSDRESSHSGRISRDAGIDSRSPKIVGSIRSTERRFHLADNKPSMNNLNRRTMALYREVLQSDRRASKAIKKSQVLSRRVNDKVVSKSVRDFYGSEKEIRQRSTIADSYDADDVILSNDQGNKLVMQLSLNGSSPFTDKLEMDHPGKIVQNPQPFKDEEYEPKTEYGLNHDKLFSLTIGGAVAAFLISTSLK